MNLIESQVVPVIYEDASNKVTSRVIIPTSVPRDTVKAIDVTDLSVADRTRLQQLHTEYMEYRANAMTRLFNFEDWVSHTMSLNIEPKWRTFKIAGLR